jgi:maleylacetoacetate isomerase
VHLLRDGGEQHKPNFVDRNSAGLLPVLEDGLLKLTQSVAIIEYLEEAFPSPPLLPGDAVAKARIRALALDIVCEIQPLNNLRVLQYLKTQLALDEEECARWSREWIHRGLSSVEAQLSRGEAADFCFGDFPTLADCCLVPQVFNALRIKCGLERYPNIRRIYENRRVHRVP